MAWFYTFILMGLILNASYNICTLVVFYFSLIQILHLQISYTHQSYIEKSTQQRNHILKCKKLPAKSHIYFLQSYEASAWICTSLRYQMKTSQAHWYLVMMQLNFHQRPPMRSWFFHEFPENKTRLRDQEQMHNYHKNDSFHDKQVKHYGHLLEVKIQRSRNKITPRFHSRYEYY